MAVPYCCPKLYDYRTRYYDPALGRFLRMDTIGPWGDTNNLGNPYVYVGNNPWSHTDPYGLYRYGDNNYFYDVAFGLKEFVYENPKKLVVSVWGIVTTLGSEIAHPVRTYHEFGGGIGAIGEIVAA